MSDLFNLGDIKDKVSDKLSGDIIEAGMTRMFHVYGALEKTIHAQNEAKRNMAEVVDITSRLAVSDIVEEPPKPTATVEANDPDVPISEELQQQNLAAEARQKIEWQHRKAA